MPSTASFLVELDGSELPDDVAPLLVSGYVDCSLRLPDAVMLRFRDPGRIVVEKSGVKIGSKLKVSVATDGSQTPEKLICRRGDFTGGRSRQPPDPSPSSGATTRRTGCSAAGTPCPTRKQRHPTPQSKVAQRAG